MKARHAKDFTWNRRCSSNSPPLIKHGDQIPDPLEDPDNQIPSSPGRQKCQMPRVRPEGGMLKVRFDRYINQNTEKINDVSCTHIPLKIKALMNDFLKKCEIERCDVSEPCLYKESRRDKCRITKQRSGTEE